MIVIAVKSSLFFHMNFMRKWPTSIKMSVRILTGPVKSINHFGENKHCNNIEFSKWWKYLHLFLSFKFSSRNDFVVFRVRSCISFIKFTSKVFRLLDILTRRIFKNFIFQLFTDYSVEIQLIFVYWLCILWCHYINFFDIDTLGLSR